MSLRDPRKEPPVKPAGAHLSKGARYVHGTIHVLEFLMAKYTWRWAGRTAMLSWLSSSENRTHQPHKQRHQADMLYSGRICFQGTYLYAISNAQQKETRCVWTPELSLSYAKGGPSITTRTSASLLTAWLELLNGNWMWKLLNIHTVKILKDWRWEGFGLWSFFYPKQNQGKSCKPNFSFQGSSSL